MKSKAKPIDSSPEKVLLWTHWESPDGVAEIPRHVVVTSGGGANKTKHYALVCRKPSPIVFGGGGPFDRNLCLTTNGKIMGDSQVTALLTGDPQVHESGEFEIDFSAQLMAPYCPKLVMHRELSPTERLILGKWRLGDDWLTLANELRGF